MNCFRILPDGCVIEHFSWHMMDGNAYIRVGGSRIPYLSVHASLLETGGEGEISRASLSIRDRNRAELIPECSHQLGLIRHALLLLPTAAVDFAPGILKHPVQPVDDRALKLAVIPVGKSVTMTAKCRLHADCERLPQKTIHWDGRELAVH